MNTMLPFLWNTVYIRKMARGKRNIYQQNRNNRGFVGETSVKGTSEDKQLKLFTILQFCRYQVLRDVIREVQYLTEIFRFDDKLLPFVVHVEE